MNTSLRPPIILFGNVRSGTTMIQELCNTHPDVTGWFEPRTVWTYADPRRDHDRFDASDATPRVTNYIRRRFLAYQERHGGRRVMEKTPSNVMRVPYVHAIFPEAKFVYVVREPLANLSSTDLRGRQALNRRRTLIRMRETPWTQLHWYLGRWVSDHLRVRLLGRRPQYYGVRYPGFADDAQRLDRFELIARQWLHASRQAEEDLRNIPADQLIRFRYEDFVAAPRDYFRRILALCELEMTPELDRKLTDWVDPGRQQKWKRLDRDVLERCIPIVRDEMTRLGYEIPDELRELAG